MERLQLVSQVEPWEPFMVPWSHSSEGSSRPSPQMALGGGAEAWLSAAADLLFMELFVVAAKLFSDDDCGEGTGDTELATVIELEERCGGTGGREDSLEAVAHSTIVESKSVSLSVLSGS